MHIGNRAIRLVAAAALGALSVSALSCRRNIDMRFIEDLAVMHNPTYKGGPVPREVQNEIRRIVDRYRADLQRNADAVTTLGRLYKELALSYLEAEAVRQTIARVTAQPAAEPAFGSGLEQGVYHEALALQFLDRAHYLAAWEALQKAIAISPHNDLLYYNAGLSASYVAKAFRTEKEEGQAQKWYALAESSYRRSIEIAPEGEDARYGLAMLLIFELNRPREAEPLLAVLKEKGRLQVEARFLSARLAYLDGRYMEAIGEYESIENMATAKEKKEQAARNRQAILDKMAGGKQ